MLQNHYYKANDIETGSIVVISGDIVAVWDRKARLAMWKEGDAPRARKIPLSTQLRLLHTPLTLAHQFLGSVKFGYELDSAQEQAAKFDY